MLVDNKEKKEKQSRILTYLPVDSRPATRAWSKTVTLSVNNWLISNANSIISVSQKSCAAITPSRAKTANPNRTAPAGALLAS